MAKRRSSALGSACAALLTALLASLWAALAAPAALAGPSACRLVKIGELPVRFERNRPFVPVSIDGKPAWLLVDTGAHDSLLWGGAATGLGLHQVTADHMSFYGVGGVQAARTAVIGEFGLAEVKVKDLRMFVIGARGSPQNAGLLGRDFLGRFDLEFDLADQKLRLWRLQGCGAQSLAYWSKDAEAARLEQDGRDGEYKVKVKVNGRPIDAVLDSGATISIATPEVAAAARLKPEDYGSGVEAVGGIGERRAPSRVATFATLAVGDETIQRAKLRVADMFAAATQASTGSILEHRIERLPTMLLGADFLRSHRVLLAPDQRVMYFTYSGGPVLQVVGDAPAAAPAPPAP